MAQGKRAALRALYDRELKARGFQPDPAQLAAVARLDALRARLLERERVRRSLPRKLLQLAAAPRAALQTGVY
ncbi:MAG: hypothetical protein WCE48_08635, partial [Steroidobacteraceae bacterium]